MSPCVPNASWHTALRATPARLGCQAGGSAKVAGLRHLLNCKPTALQLPWGNCLGPLQDRVRLTQLAMRLYCASSMPRNKTMRSSQVCSHLLQLMHPCIISSSSESRVIATTPQPPSSNPACHPVGSRLHVRNNVVDFCGLPRPHHQPHPTLPNRPLSCSARLRPGLGRLLLQPGVHVHCVRPLQRSCCCRREQCRCHLQHGHCCCGYCAAGPSLVVV